MGLDVRPEPDLEGLTCLEHLEAIPLNHGLIQDCGRRRNIFQVLANEGFTKCCVGWQGKKASRIKCHSFVLGPTNYLMI